MKIGALIVNRANWARSKTVLEALVAADVEVVIYSASSMNLEKYGSAVDRLYGESQMSITKLMTNIDGTTLETQALSTGFLITMLAPRIASDSLDGLLVVADRYEVIAGAICGSYLNVPVIHIQGGEISGNIDNKVRFATSFLSDLHFPCSNEAYQRLKKLIPNGNIFNFGCPAIDLADRYSARDSQKVLSETPHIGIFSDKSERYFVVTLHPDTERYEGLREDAQKFFGVVDELSAELNGIIIWPNVDGGSDKISKVIRSFREDGKLRNCKFYKNFDADDFPSIIKNASLCLGNSSSFLREGAHFGTPSVIVGGRQSNRDIYSNAITCSFEKTDILSSVRAILSKKIKPQSPFGKGDAGRKIAQQVIETLSLT